MACSSCHSLNAFWSQVSLDGGGGGTGGIGLGGGGGGGGGGVFFRAGGTLLRPPLPKTGGATPSDLPANTRFFFFLRGCIAAAASREC